MRKQISIVLCLAVAAGMLAGPAEAKKKKKKVVKVEREVTLTYNTPGGVAGRGATADVAGNSVGGGNLTPAPGEAYVNLSIVDQTGQPVYASLGQDTNGDMQVDTATDFCGSTTEPAAIDPAYQVIVIIYEGPCIEPAPGPGAATTGTVTATFSNLP